MTVCPHPKDLLTTLNWVLENQPIVWGKEGQVVICIYVHYKSIYTIDLLCERQTDIFDQHIYQSCRESLHVKILTESI